MRSLIDSNKKHSLLITGTIFLLFIIGCILAGIIACGLFKNVAWCEWWPDLTLVRIVEFIKTSGPWGVGVSIGIMILHSFVPFPAEFIAIANGMIFGTFWGTVITWAGAMLGAFLAFGLSRVLGRPFVQSVLSADKMQTVDRWVKSYGGGTLFISRFIPVIAFNLINYVAGLTRIPWWTFAWTTGIGILPMTIIMVIIGAGITNLSFRMKVLMLLAILLISLIAHRIFRQYDG